ncbi:hypothetical protein KI387_007965, partial [Taxus chinensis]
VAGCWRCVKRSLEVLGAGVTGLHKMEEPFEDPKRQKTPKNTQKRLKRAQLLEEQLEMRQVS